MRVMEERPKRHVVFYEGANDMLFRHGANDTLYSPDPKERSFIWRQTTDKFPYTIGCLEREKTKNNVALYLLLTYYMMCVA